MKGTRLAVLALWTWSLCTMEIAIAGTPAPDLEPEEGSFSFVFGQDPYYATVAELLLGSDNYRKCQMVFLPSFGKESAVYILRNDDGKEAKTKVVLTEMKQQLWNMMMKFLKDEAGDGKSYSVAPEAQRRALTHVSREVRRTEAEIDVGTAILLERAWEGMLSRVRYPAPKDRLGMDGETFHIAHFVRGRGYRTGQTWSPDQGTRTHDFVELAKALRSFTQSAGAERETAHRDVVARAEALLERLKKDN